MDTTELSTRLGGADLGGEHLSRVETENIEETPAMDVDTRTPEEENKEEERVIITETTTEEPTEITPSTSTGALVSNVQLIPEEYRDLFGGKNIFIRFLYFL